MSKQLSAKNISEANDFLYIANMVYELIPIERAKVKASLNAEVWLNDFREKQFLRDNWAVEIQGFVAGLWASGVIDKAGVIKFKKALAGRGVRVIPENFTYVDIIPRGSVTSDDLKRIAKTAKSKPAARTEKLNIIKNLKQPASDHAMRVDSKNSHSK